MRRLILGLICVALVQITALEPARTQGTQPAGKPFRIAQILGVTGALAASMASNVSGARAAAKKLNEQGGILGRPVEVVVFDHQFDPARAVRVLQDDVLTQSWDEISPGGGSLTTLPMLPFVTKAKVLAIATVSSPNLTQLTSENPYFFSLQPSTLDAGNAFAQYIKKLGVKKLGVLYSTDPLGVNTDKAYEAAVAKVGIPVISESYDIATVDITPTLLKLKAAAPDRLFVVAFGAPAGHVLNSLDKLGWDIPIVGDLGFGLTNLTLLAPARTWSKLTVEEFRLNAYVPPAQRSAKLNDFIARLKAEGPLTQGLYTYSAGWDMVMLAAMAARQANSTDPAKMVAALEHLNAPPRDRLFMNYNNYVYAPTDHQPQTDPSEYSFVPYTPFVDGMIGNPQ